MRPTQWIAVVVFVVGAATLVSVALSSSKHMARHDAEHRACDVARDTKDAACEGARTRAEGLAAALGKPEMETEAIAAARELATWVSYCRGGRAVVPVTGVDVGRLRSDLIDFSKGH